MGISATHNHIQEMTRLLQARAVALVNVDIGASGNETLKAEGAPSLYRLLLDAAKCVLKNIISLTSVFV